MCSYLRVYAQLILIDQMQARWSRPKPLLPSQRLNQSTTVPRTSYLVRLLLCRSMPLTIESQYGTAHQAIGRKQELLEGSLTPKCLANIQLDNPYILLCKRRASHQSKTLPKAFLLPMRAISDSHCTSPLLNALCKWLASKE